MGIGFVLAPRVDNDWSVIDFYVFCEFFVN
jgi:hypothetical protein